MLKNEMESSQYLKMMRRKWNKGDVYAPRDLSPFEMKGRINKAYQPSVDVVGELGFSPLDNYRVSFCPRHSHPFF